MNYENIIPESIKLGSLKLEIIKRSRSLRIGKLGNSIVIKQEYLLDLLNFLYDVYPDEVKSFSKMLP